MTAQPDDTLIYEASQGSTDAQLRLADLNLSAWASGALGQLEALAGAELWARLAASSGRPDAVTVLAEVFTARATFDGLRGLTDSAGWYEAEAQRRRRVAGLVERPPEAPPPINAIEPSPTPAHDAYIAAAAKGDPEALRALFDDAVRLIRERICEPIEGLAIAELIGRMAAARGDPGSLWRLASILGARADHERSLGNLSVADGATAEGIALLSIASDDGDATMTPLLQSMVHDIGRDGVVSAVKLRASILAHVQPLGNC